MTLHEVTERLGALPAHVLAGVSGGADSVALLLALTSVSGTAVEAVHVNHGLRGEASDGDEAFVRALCEQQNVLLHVYRAVPPPHPGEGWAREARYGFFRQAMAESGADALVLAHHRDDQAETLLLHLLRGAGLDGLAGMRPDAMLDGMRVLRPLLTLTRDELREALTQAGQPWREDATNADPHYLRNAVRTQLIPLMEQLAPGASARTAATAALLAGERDARDALVERFLAAHAGEDWLTLAPLAEQPVAMQAAILRAWWQQRVGHAMDERSLDRAQTAALTALVGAKAGAACNLPGRWQARRGWRCLHLVAPQKADVPVPVTAQNGAALCGVALQITPGDGTTGDGALCQTLPQRLLDGCCIRTRRSGDWLRPFGGAGRKQLQDYLTDRRVDAPFRDRIPLLCRGSEVLLAAGVGAGDIPPMTGGEPDAVCVSWQGAMPWVSDTSEKE